jgi:DnaJ-domain-containing protein 1
LVGDRAGIQYYFSTMQDYYEVLELDTSAQAEQIKQNYRRLAMQWHPDRNQGSKAAEEKFKLISEAYATLSDQNKRAQYDAYLSSGGQAGYESARAGAQASQAGQYAQGGYGYAQGFGNFWGFSAFNAQDAQEMFTREMYSLAIELTLHNVGWRDIAAELERRGCPAEVAAEIARKIETQRKRGVREVAKPYFLRSAVSGFFGLCLFGLFGGVGLGILGFLGLLMFVSGAYNLIRALYFITTGNAPKTLIG